VAEVVVEVPPSLRGELKDPLGPIHTDAADLLAETAPPVVVVGDMVTYHLVRTGHVPDVALIDGRTERTAVDEEVGRRIDRSRFDREVTVANPAATLTAELLEALADALARAAGGTSTRISVDGEEDLATLPAVAAAPTGASVVYGQPGEGMVLVTVDRTSRGTVRDLLARMEGELDRLWSLIDPADSTW